MPRKNPEARKAYDKERYAQHRQRERTRSMQRYRDDPNHWYWVSIQRRFGLSEERYRELYAKGCWLCGLPFPPALDRYQVHVDHNHDTQEVRGLTHGACNAIIGHAKEDPALLRRIEIALEAYARTKISARGNRGDSC